MGASGDDDMADLVISSLPLETRCPPYPLRQHGGFWLSEPFLQAVVAARALFETRPSDVLLASFPKSGTTWLKALALATLHRADHLPRGLDHPLRRHNPHDCVEYLEEAFASSAAEDSDGDVLAALPSPRLLATHLPYNHVPKSVTTEGTGCKIVYVCRDPKDTLVSKWLLTKKRLALTAVDHNPPKPYTIDEMFELFCDGRCTCGPQWHHVLGYWEASRRQPEKVLFLRYEEMLRDPVGNVRKMAEC